MAAEETETCAGTNLSGEGRMILKCFADEQLIKRYISSVIQNEQRTFTLPKNIIN